MQTASFFPGFGAFAAAMDALNSTGFLGICLGLQLLFKSSKENGPGQGKGFDIDLIKFILDAVNITVIASRAGAVEHFSEVLMKINASAALASIMFAGSNSVCERAITEGRHGSQNLSSEYC
ncbi:imidazole glycerol phosphate synthase hisHF, chloroplastic-like [Tripterygium wilfordii]|uniref:imidazole glycerol phosphate synthase hisHF, chloroplastic-like n=1 Tax=Tripterygium wilfordii TaxID=458696 RepID=UPI0018F8355E|nr:imidazole glycerol phosphate synthase hisHF, chloroplastic-like [Tripterygium wilfordii]XP_038691170.1 imidazole glycerol phosphate synthase hisHF, chloroplastic-like [Tripterygium wilfordii]